MSAVGRGRVLLAVMLLTASSVCGQEGQAERQGVRPVPEEAAQVDVRRGLRTKYAKDFADVTVAGKRRLAAMLMREAGMGAGDAAIYVALVDAKELAAGCGEVELALQAADELGRQFNLDHAAVRFATMQACLRGKLSPAQGAVLARAAKGVAEVRLAADDFEGASRAASIADEAARGTGDVALQTDTAMLADYCREVVKQGPAFKMATETLTNEPENPAANQQAGEFLVLVKQEWGRGLLLLSRGTNVKLKQAATLELAQARGAELVEAAEAWAALAQTKRGPARVVAARHARQLFEKAAADLSGDAKSKCLERVAAMVNLLPTVELVDTRAARTALGELRWSWVEGLKLGGLESRDDVATLVNFSIQLQWKPRVDERGEMVSVPEEGATLASSKEGRLTYHMRVLCVDDVGREVVLEREMKVQLRNVEKSLKLQGPPNKDIKRLNRGSLTPAGVYVMVRMDGVVVAERVWRTPAKKAWWLDESLVERRDK